MTEFTQDLVKKHFDWIENELNRNDAHSEYFYIEFYFEHLQDTDIITDSVKQQWMNQWKEDYEDEECYDFTQSFDEFLEENEERAEDVACQAIGESDVVKELAVPKLFEHIAERWSDESIKSLVQEVN